MLPLVGEDAHREGLERHFSSCRNHCSFLQVDIQQDIAKVLNDAIFNEKKYSAKVIVKDMDIFSLCEHHLLLYGKAHIAYIPRTVK